MINPGATAVLPGKHSHGKQIFDVLSHAEGVYFNIVNISHKDPEPMLKPEIPFDENVMFLDADLSL
ncbi:unnamed protein product, partial [marine sediment metagenome]